MQGTVSDAELIARLIAVRKHGTISAAARAEGWNRTHTSQLVVLAKQRGFTADTPIVDPVAKLKLELARVKSELEMIRGDNLTTAEIRRTIYGLAEHRPEPPEWIFGKGSGGDRGAPMTFWSDWHRGEIVHAAEVGGVNEFNSAIHDARVKRLVGTTLDLCFEHMGRPGKNYPGIVIGLGGDFINGSLHPADDDADRTDIQNVNELTDILAGAIDNMAAKFSKVYLPAVVGNHGRNTVKPRSRSVVHTNYEWLVYQNLARYFNKSKHVVIDISEQTDVWFQCFGHRFLFTHGDRLGVKGGDGIIGAIGPIMRGSIKVGRSEAQIGRDFDTIVMGHWHQYLTLPGIIVNSSLKGYDNFARNVLRASYQRPSQALWFVHPVHGITAQWPVYLEPPLKGNHSDKWITLEGAKP